MYNKADMDTNPGGQMQSTKNIWLMGWVSFFTDLATAMIKPVIPVYVVLILHQGVDKLGIVVAISTFISFALRWLGGWLSDYYGRSKPFLIAGYGLSSLTKPLIGLAPSWQIVALLSGTERLGKAIRSASKDKLISLSSDAKKQGRAFGLHKTLDISGEVLGALVAFMILHWFGKTEYWIREIFYWTALPSLLSMFLLVFFVKDIKSDRQVIEQTESDIMASGFTPRLKLKLTLFFSASFLMVSESFMLIRAHEAGILVSFLPLLLVAGTLSQALLSYLSGRSADENGDERVLLAGVFSGLVSLLLLASGQHDLVAMSFIFQGIFMVTTLNAVRMRLGKFQHAKGKVYGWFYAVNAVVSASAALLTGWLWEILGGTETLTAFAAIYAVLMVTYFIGRSRCCAGA